MKIELCCIRKVNNWDQDITSWRSHQITLIYLSQPMMLNHQSLFSLSFQKNVHKIFWMSSWTTTNKWPVHFKWWTRDWFFLILSFQTRRELIRLQLDKADQTTINSNKSSNKWMNNQLKKWMNSKKINSNTKSSKFNKIMQMMKEENRKSRMLAKKKTTINNSKWNNSKPTNKCEILDDQISKKEKLKNILIYFD